MERSTNPFIDSFLNMLVAERGATVNTVSAYLNDISHFEEHLIENEASSRIETCSKENITNYIGSVSYTHLTLPTKRIV